MLSNTLADQNVWMSWESWGDCTKESGGNFYLEKYLLKSKIRNNDIFE